MDNEPTSNPAQAEPTTRVAALAALIELESNNYAADSINSISIICYGGAVSADGMFFASSSRGNP